MHQTKNNLLSYLYELFFYSNLNINNIEKEIYDCIYMYIKTICNLHNIDFNDKYFKKENILDVICFNEYNLILNSNYLIDDTDIDFLPNYSKNKIINYIYNIYMQSDFSINKIDKNIYRICCCVVFFKYLTQIPQMYGKLDISVVNKHLNKQIDLLKENN